jgi:hypothetical protein
MWSEEIKRKVGIQALRNRVEFLSENSETETGAREGMKKNTFSETQEMARRAFVTTAAALRDWNTADLAMIIWTAAAKLTAGSSWKEA